MLAIAFLSFLASLATLYSQQVIFFDPERIFFQNQNSSFFFDITTALSYLSENVETEILRIALAKNGTLQLQTNISFQKNVTIEGMMVDKIIGLNFQNDAHIGIGSNSVLNLKNILILKNDGFGGFDSLFYLGKDAHVKLEVIYN